MQAKALHDAGCCRIFEKAASGARWDRPELHRMLEQLRDGDVVVVWKLDRLSRSLKDVLHKRGAVGSPSELGRTLDDCGATFCGSNREPNKMVLASIMIWSVLRSPPSHPFRPLNGRVGRKIPDCPAATNPPHPSRLGQ